MIFKLLLISYGLQIFSNPTMESPELSCAGFQENVVLALKNHFYEEEIRYVK